MGTGQNCRTQYVDSALTPLVTCRWTTPSSSHLDSRVSIVVVCGYRSNLPLAEEAVAALGALIAVRRRELKFTATEFAERVGVTRVTLRKIEQGDPSVAVGTVFTAAVVAGIPLFGADDRRDLAAVRGEIGRLLALLPSRVDRGPVDNDF